MHFCNCAAESWVSSSLLAPTLRVKSGSKNFHRYNVLLIFSFMCVVFYFKTWFNLLNTLDTINLTIYTSLSIYPHTVKWIYFMFLPGKIVPTIFVGRDLLKSVSELPLMSPKGIVATTPMWESVTLDNEVIPGIANTAFMVRGAWQSQWTPGNGLCGSDMWGIYLRQTSVWKKEWRLTSKGTGLQAAKKWRVHWHSILD